VSELARHTYGRVQDIKREQTSRNTPERAREEQDSKRDACKQERAQGKTQNQQRSR